MARHPELRIIGIACLPEIGPGDDLVSLIAGAARNGGLTISAGDVFVVTQKIVSKAEGRLARIAEVRPSILASRWAEQHNKDARLIELILREAVRIVRMERGVLIAETPQGFVCANAGVDSSNVADDLVALLPRDPDASAQALASGLSRAFAQPVAVVISDTFGRPWREGVVNVAIGVAGLQPFVDYRGQTDGSGRLLQTTRVAIADELASAAELVMRKTSGIPAAIIKGAHYASGDGKGRDLVRAAELDLFR